MDFGAVHLCVSGHANKQGGVRISPSDTDARWLYWSTKCVQSIHYERNALSGVESPLFYAPFVKRFWTGKPSPKLVSSFNHEACLRGDDVCFLVDIQVGWMFGSGRCLGRADVRAGPIVFKGLSLLMTSDENGTVLDEGVS